MQKMDDIFYLDKSFSGSPIYDPKGHLLYIFNKLYIRKRTLIVILDHQMGQKCVVSLYRDIISGKIA
jgi:hypothetical protein